MITTQEKALMHRICITYDFKLTWYLPGSGERIHAIDDWLEKNVPENEYLFEFEDYGQHGEYILYITKIEDLVAMKLAIGVNE